jgi:hypothetical protein
MNKHKEMILKKLWLTKAEIESIETTIEDYDEGRTAFLSNISEIIINAKKRGDFK